MGVKMEFPTEQYHWAIIFELIPPDEKPIGGLAKCLGQKTVKETYDEEIKQDGEDGVEGMLKQIFTDRALKDFVQKAGFDSVKTKKEFHEKARNVLIEIVTSTACNLKVMTEESIDLDEVFLLLQLPYDPKVPPAQSMALKLADRQEIKLPIKETEYAKVEIKDAKARMVPAQCPTEQFISGMDFDAAYPKVPMHLRYDINQPDKFQALTETDLIKLTQTRLREFIKFEGSQNCGFCKSIFAIHNKQTQDKFFSDGFANPMKIMLPEGKKGKTADDVRQYFGEEVGFFFHWFNFYTRWLTVPAVLGLLAFTRRFVGLSLVTQRYIQWAFAVVMIMWSACFAAYYPQAAMVKIEKWGMRNFLTTAAPRRGFDPKKQGMPSESARRNFHWILAAAFMMEAILATAAINMFRDYAKHLPEDETIMGFSGKSAGKLGKTLVTLNIKVVDIIWGLLSPKLSMGDNWRTDQDLKDAMVNKMFGVKFIVYYYPFFYYAFIQEKVEGCHPIAPAGAQTACMDSLVLNLEIFFVTHICTAVAMLIVPIVLFRLTCKAEMAKAVGGKKFTYIQAQAKCADYMGDTDDMMELVLSLGFLMMFAVALPVMATLAWFCNLLELRLQGFKMVYVMRRASPRGQEGIGSWQGIIMIVSKVAVIVNVGMAVFTMVPCKLMPMQMQLLIFVAVEHMMLSVTMIIEKGTAKMDVATSTMIELAEDIGDDIMGDVSKPVTVDSTSPVDIGMDMKPDSA